MTPSNWSEEEVWRVLPRLVKSLQEALDAASGAENSTSFRDRICEPSARDSAVGQTGADLWFNASKEAFGVMLSIQIQMLTFACSDALSGS